MSILIFPYYFNLCDIYFWVNWKQLEYRNISIQPVRGIWRAEFRNMAREIEDKTVENINKNCCKCELNNFTGMRNCAI